MNTQEKLNRLSDIVRAMGLSQEDIEHWYKQNKLRSQNTGRIETPLSLIYIKNDKIEVLPYLDLERKYEIWGIKSAGQAVKLTHENGQQPMDWYAAMAAVNNVTIAGKALAIPKRAELDRHRQEIDDFNKTVKILKQHEIEADFWNMSWYWTPEEYSSGSAYSYSLNNGLSYSYHKSNFDYVRVVLPL